MALFDGREQVQAPPEMVWQAAYEFARKGKVEIEQPRKFLMATQAGVAYAYLLMPEADGSTQLWHVIDRAGEFHQQWHDNSDPAAVLNALVNMPTSTAEETLKSARSMLAGLVDLRFDSASLLQGEERLKRIKKSAEKAAQQAGWVAVPFSSVTPLTEEAFTVPPLVTAAASPEAESEPPAPLPKRQIAWKRILPALAAVILLVIVAVVKYAPTVSGDVAVMHFNRGIELDQKEEWDAAIEEYTLAIQADGKLAEAYVNRGRAYFQRSKWKAALADFDKAIALNPKVEMAFRNRGLVYYFMGELDKAEADAHQAVKIDPKSALAYLLCGMVHADQNENTDAKPDLEKAIALGLDPDLKQTAEQMLEKME